jgi:rhodanese-related sulfurtransferase
MKTKNNSLRNIVFLGVGILLVLAVIVGANLLTPKTQSAQIALPMEVSVKEAAEMEAAGAFVLDVRQPEEWNQGHIEGATLIPLGDLSARLSELPADQDIVIVCRSGNRSAQGRDILRDGGLSRSTSMSGGMNEWAAQGYPLATGP